MWVDRLFVCVALWQLLTSWGKGGFSSAHRITKLFFKKTSIIFNFYWYIFKACRWKVLIRVSDCLRGFKQELLVTVHFTFTYFVKIWLLFMFSPSLSPSHIFFFSLCSVLDSFLCLFFLTCKKKQKTGRRKLRHLIWPRDLRRFQWKKPLAIWSAFILSSESSVWRAEHSLFHECVCCSGCAICVCIFESYVCVVVVMRSLL